MGKVRNSLLLVLVAVSITSLGLTSNQAFGNHAAPAPVPLPFPTNPGGPTIGPIGDYRCWDFSPPGLPHLPVFPLVFGGPVFVGLQDQFGPTFDQIGESVEFCASAIKNGLTDHDNAPFLTNHHYVGYDLSNNPPIIPQTNTWVVPQFQLTIRDLTVTQPVELLVPTTKSFLGDFPYLTDLHYKCYDASHGPAVSISVNLQTQFHPPSDDFLFQTYLVCNPVIKEDANWTPPDFGAQVPEHLVCFLNSPSDQTANLPLIIDNQFTFGVPVPILLGDPHKACFEALKDPTVAVGGTLLGVDTTAVALAGAQMTLSWMVPFIVAAAGIGLVVVSKFRSNKA